MQITTIQDGPLLVLDGVINPSKWPYEWVTGVTDPYKWSYHPSCD